VATLNISLPDTLAEFVEQQVAEGGFRTPSEYFHRLVREDQQRRAEARLEGLLLEALDSGPSAPMTADDWTAIRRRGLERATARSEAGSNGG
jgi:antitoxin ParD1/3/4